MSNKFLSSTSSTELSNGSSIIIGRTLSAANLTPSSSMRTDATGIIVSSDLSISDITNLQTELDSATSQWNRSGTIISPKTSGDTVSVDGINEQTVDEGVTVETILMKAGTITLPTSDAPTVDAMVANKKYVDDQIGGEDHWDRTGTTIQPHVLGDEVAMDIINEQTVGEGVTIEGMLMKDSILYTDTINEDISDAGVTIETILLKDGNILPTVDDTSYLGSATKQYKDAYFTTGSIDYTAGEMNTDIIRLNTSNINLREGASVQDYTTSYTTAASVLTYTITDASGTGIIAFFLDGKTLVHVGATMNLDITLYAGTDANPKDIHIYIENDGADNPIMVAGNAHPVSIHSDVAQMKVGLVSATSSTVYSEVSGGIIPDEMLYKMSHRFYHQGSLYVDGCGITATSSDVTIATGNVMQILNERASIQRQVTIDGLFVISSAGVYSTQTNFTFTEYSNGTAIGVNKFHNVVLGILVDGDTKIMALVQDEPISEYNTLLAASNDQYNTLVTFPTDSNLNKLFIPICRIILQTGALQDLGTSDYYINLRGVGQGSTNSSAGGVTDHGNLTGLADDDHTQYARLNGRAGNKLFIDTLEAQTSAAMITFEPNGAGNSYLKLERETTGNVSAIMFDTTPSGIEWRLGTTSSQDFILYNEMTSAFAYNIDAATSDVTIYNRLNTGSSDAPIRSLTVSGPDSNADTGPHISLVTTGSSYPLCEIYAYTTDIITFMMDAYSDSTGTAKSSTTTGNFQIRKANDNMCLQYDSGVAAGSAITWNDGLCMDLTNGFLSSEATYNNSIGTQHDVHCDITTFEFGYNASIRASKINIIDMPDASSLYDLTPVQFNYRKKINREWSEIPQDETNYGFIADDITDDKLIFRADVPEGENIVDQEILGLKKMSLISLAIKAIQEQKVIIDAQATQIVVLQARDTAIEARLSALELV